MIIQEGKEDIQKKRDKGLHQKEKINAVLDSHLLEDTLNCVPQSEALIKSNRNTSDIVLPDLEFKPHFCQQYVKCLRILQERRTFLTERVL
jgi:hypothetical protein